MGSHITPGDAFEYEPKNTVAYGGVMRITSSAFRQEERIPTRYSCEGGRYLAGTHMGGSTSRDCGIRFDFARSGCTQDEWLYALDALQHSSQCHAHPRKCAGRSEGERSRTARQERWREGRLYGTVPTVRNSPLLPEVVCLAKGTGPTSGGHSARVAVRNA